MRRREVGMTGDNFRHLLNCRSSIASHQAARIEVVVGHLVGVLHGKDLILLRQVPQVTFDSVLLDRVLIGKVDPEISGMLPAENQQPGKTAIKVRGTGDNHFDLVEMGPHFG